MKDTLIEVTNTTTCRLDPDVEYSHQQHVRLYSAGPTWASLQIRSHGPINPRGNGKSYDAYSDASLTIDAATQLREALNVWINEQHKAGRL